MLTKYALVAVIVLCLTVLGFTLLVGDSLCEFTVKERNIEFRLFSLTNRRSSRCAGSNPRISGCQVWMVRHLLYTFARSQQWLRANRTGYCQLIVLAQRDDSLFFYLPVHSKLLILSTNDDLLFIPVNYLIIQKTLNCL